MPLPMLLHFMGTMRWLWSRRYQCIPLHYDSALLRVMANDDVGTKKTQSKSYELS